MARLRKILLWLLVAVILFSVIGFFVAPPVLKSVMVRKLSTELGRNVTIGKIRVNPYTLGVTIRAVTVSERGGPGTFLRFDEFKVRLAPSIVTGVIALYDLTVANPYINIVRRQDGSYNFSDLLKKKASSKDKAGKESGGITFSLQDITIRNGSADFLDEPVKKKHVLREFNVSIPLLSNRPKYVERYVRPTLSWKLNDDPYAIEGRTKPFADSLETVFDINIENLDIFRYLAYLPMKMRFSVPSGYLDTKIELSFMQHKNKTPSLALKGDLTVSKLVVNDEEGRTVLNLPALQVSMRSVEPLARKLELSRVAIESPEFTISRDRKAALNIMALVPEMKETEKVKGTDKAAKPGKEPDKEPFQWAVDVVELTGGKVLFTDSSLANPARMTLEKLELKGEKLSGAKGPTGIFSASLLVNNRGTVNLKGKIGLDPLSVDAKLDAEGIDIRPFQPYFTDKVRVAVTSGRAKAAGDLLVNDAGKKGLSVRFTGMTSLTGFAAVDKESAESLLTMKSLHVRSLDMGYNPTIVAAKDVALTDFYASIAVRADRTVNLQHIMVKDEKEAAISGEGIEKTAQPGKQAKKEEGASSRDEAVPVKVDTVTLQGGTIRFQDQSVNPVFSTKLGQIAGRISGLSSKENTTANVELRGTLNNSAPLEITGKINPLSKDLYVDLTASFKDMDLTPATPYSGKYAGYTVDKGKLSFDVQYLIEKRKLDSKNVIFIDQLTFGDRVESPDATKLPVKLAVALLKDRSGQIKLDLPVTGSLDDPQFSIGRIVLKIIVNLLTKAATAPFALIGAMFGGGEELGYIEFDYGRAAITGTGLKKIETLARVLADKPSLRMDIEGYADPERDREGLKQYLIQKKVKTQKLKDLMKKNSANIDVDDVKVEPGEYEKYLRLAYKAEKFPKPRNIIGFEKSVPVEEMEKLMLTHTIVNEEDLHSLARRRSARVLETLVKAGRVEAGRLFVVEPKSLAPQKKDKLKDSRVEFKLK